MSAPLNPLVDILPRFPTSRDFARLSTQGCLLYLGKGTAKRAVPFHVSPEGRGDRTKTLRGCRDASGLREVSFGGAE